MKPDYIIPLLPAKAQKLRSWLRGSYNEYTPEHLCAECDAEPIVTVGEVLGVFVPYTYRFQ